MSVGKKYDLELQARAVRMVVDRVAEGASQLLACREIGGVLDVPASTLRNWVRREDSAPGGSERVEEELTRLRREVGRLRKANEILRTASAFFASAELDRKLGQ